MRRFAALYAELDRTASALAKREAIVAYLRDAPAADAAWAVYVLGGGKLRRLAKSGELRQALAAATGYADWLIDESYEKVGDLAETIALMLPAGDGTIGDVSLHMCGWKIGCRHWAGSTAKRALRSCRTGGAACCRRRCFCSTS